MTTINRKRRRLAEKIKTRLLGSTLYITDCNGGLGGCLVEVNKKTLLKLLEEPEEPEVAVRNNNNNNNPFQTR